MLYGLSLVLSNGGAVDLIVKALGFLRSYAVAWGIWFSWEMDEEKMKAIKGEDPAFRSETQ